MMDLSENFLKLIQLSLLVVGVLSIWFTFVDYNIKVEAKSVEREAIIEGNFLLSSDCLTLYDTKGLFSESNLDSLEEDPECLRRQNLKGYVLVELEESEKKWAIDITEPTMEKSVQFSVNVRMASGETKDASMVVKL